MTFIFSQTNLEAISEDVVAALDNKNPQIKTETASFLSRCFSKCTTATLPKKMLKMFCTALLKVGQIFYCSITCITIFFRFSVAFLYQCKC